MRTGKMKDITQFDAEFFNYPPALAERADPQQRMLLEVVYETIIDAGLLIYFFKKMRLYYLIYLQKIIFDFLIIFIHKYKVMCFVNNS